MFKKLHIWQNMTKKKEYKKFAKATLKIVEYKSTMESNVFYQLNFFNMQKHNTMTILCSSII